MSGREQRPARLAWSLWGLVVLLTSIAMVFLVLAIEVPLPEDAFGFRGFAAVWALVYATFGALVASRQPRNAIGWLFLGVGITSAVQELSQEYAMYSLLLRTGDLPAGAVAAWVTTWIWVPMVWAASAMVFLLFPDGRLPSPAWRPVAFVSTASMAIAALGFAVTPGEAEGFIGVRNPLGVQLPRAVVDAVAFGAVMLFVATVVASVVALLRRFRRATGDERQQVKWVVAAASLLGFVTLSGLSVYTASTVVPVDDALLDVASNAMILAFLTLPAAGGVAVLRHGLYDIDVVINRAVVFGLLGAFITTVYVGIVVGVGALIGRRGGLVLPGVAAAVVALAFQPARQRARHLANRLVYGKRATPYEVLSDFSDRVGAVSLVEDVLPRMADLVRQGTGAVRATVWVRVAHELKPAATSPPEDGPGPPSVPARADTMPDLPGERALPIRHRGELLGALTVTKGRGDPLTPAEEKLLEDVAAQAGLVLRNVRLVEELRASRQRIVAAQDQERRRIERNIHDGAQQQLVALAVKLRLIESLIAKDPERAARTARELRGEAQTALEDLRDLARGIYPPLLADAGLTAALEAQARKAPFEVAMEVDGVGRYGQDVEAAVYFCVLEALQNASKYADGAPAHVRLWREDGDLAFAVTDEGGGFDPARTPRGSGLQNMVDRIEALGGTLEVRSEPGEGTTVEGRLPAQPLAAAQASSSRSGSNSDLGM